MISGVEHNLPKVGFRMQYILSWHWNKELFFSLILLDTEIHAPHQTMNTAKRPSFSNCDNGKYFLLPMQLTSARADPLVYFPMGRWKEQFHTFNPYQGTAHILYIVSAELNLDKVDDSLKKKKQPFGDCEAYCFDFSLSSFIKRRGRKEKTLLRKKRHFLPVSATTDKFPVTRQQRKEERNTLNLGY